MGVERGSAGYPSVGASSNSLELRAMSAPTLPRGRARRLRREQTDAERELWMRLRRHRLGVQFRSQHPIGPFIADFCCVRRMLIVEVTADIIWSAARRTRRAARGWRSSAFACCASLMPKCCRRWRRFSRKFRTACRPPPAPFPKTWGEGSERKPASGRISKQASATSPPTAMRRGRGRRVAADSGSG